MNDWFGIIYTAAIVVCAIIASGQNERPYRVKMCLVESGANKEDVSTNVWSDMIETYQERYPGSFCGTCQKEKECPTRKKKK